MRRANPRLQRAIEARDRARFNWRDPDMPVLRSWLQMSTMGFVIEKITEVVTPEFSSNLSKENVEADDESAPHYSVDPTYNLVREVRKKRRKRYMTRLSAPWTDTQVKAINQFQETPTVHPFTCAEHSDVALKATNNRMFCPVDGCDYTQSWVHEGMAGVKR